MIKRESQALKAAEAELRRKSKLIEKAEKECHKRKLEASKSVTRSAKEKIKTAEEEVETAREKYVEAEFELEVIKRKTYVEEIFWRFPHMGCQILEALDDQSLIKSCEVNKWWQKFIKGYKITPVRKIQKFICISNEATRKTLEKETLKKLIEISNCSEVFLGPFEDSAPKSSPLYHFVDILTSKSRPNHLLYLIKLIVQCTKDPDTLNKPHWCNYPKSEPVNEYILQGGTVLHTAALKNHLRGI